MSSAKVRVGTSGFSYKDWLGNFYPNFCPDRDFLRFYASQFNTVEIDATFYRIPAPSTVERWVANTPQDFVFAAKFPRTVTHEGEDSSRVEEAGRFLEVMRGLGDKLGPLLLQFAYGFKPDQYPLLEKLVGVMPDDLQICVELRNKKWLTDDLYNLLKGKNIALCLIDHPWMPRLKVQTGPFQYLRFLGDRKKIESDFSWVRDDREEDLRYWREVIRGASQQGADVFVYINNHYTGHSPTTAKRLQELLAAD
ncbi:DUF72 domain-containing protein [candidate division GN15 bacterium]|nr:DUF72 domain-containing protein [candidate division GN15 bacterium]